MAALCKELNSQKATLEKKIKSKPTSGLSLQKCVATLRVLGPSKFKQPQVKVQSELKESSLDDKSSQTDGSFDSFISDSDQLEAFKKQKEAELDLLEKELLQTRQYEIEQLKRTHAEDL